jgi:hypothetical protein
MLTIGDIIEECMGVVLKEVEKYEYEIDTKFFEEVITPTISLLLVKSHILEPRAESLLLKVC